LSYPLPGLHRPKFGTKFGVRGHLRAFESGDMSPHSKMVLLKNLASPTLSHELAPWARALAI